MKTNDQNPGNGNRTKENDKQQSQNRDKANTNKKPVYIKDMPPIDTTRPGVI